MSITTERGTIYVCPAQQFFDPVLEQWIATKDLTKKNTFLDTQLNHFPCLNIEIIDAPKTKTYHLSTNTPHNFFVTKQELL